MEEVRYRVVVTGRVQGVGMRCFLRNTAQLHGVSGWARNLDGGDVELEVQGRPENVELFLLAAEKGNRFSDVCGMEKKRIPALDEHGFWIRD